MIGTVSFVAVFIGRTLGRSVCFVFDAMYHDNYTSKNYETCIKLKVLSSRVFGIKNGTIGVNGGGSVYLLESLALRKTNFGPLIIKIG
jgi:hypothetical protein